MTPKQKAEQLVKAFEDIVMFDWTYSEAPLFNLQKDAALIVVNEILNSFEEQVNKKLNNVSQALSTPQKISPITNDYKKYWNQVKEEINGLNS